MTEEIRHVYNERALKCMGMTMPCKDKDCRTSKLIGEGSHEAEEQDNREMFRAVLQHKHKHPFEGVVQTFEDFRYRGRKLHVKKIEEILRGCEQKGLLLKIPIRMRRRGAAKHFHVLTPKGCKCASVEETIIPEGGSELGHAFKEEICAQHLRMNGIKAAKRAKKVRKVVDVGAEYKGDSIAFEIVCSTIQTEGQQAKKDLKEWDFVVTILDSKKEVSHAEKLFKEEFGDELDERVTLVEWWHVLNTCDLSEIYRTKNLVYEV